MLPTKTRAKIAEEYQIDISTLRRWLKDADLKLPKGALAPKSQHLIYDAFGYPPCILEQMKKQGLKISDFV